MSSKGSISTTKINNHWQANGNNQHDRDNDLEAKDIVDLTIYEYEQNGNELIVRCKKCNSPCPIYKDSPFQWICNKCNIIYSSASLELHSEQATLKDSISSPTGRIGCILMESENNITYDSDYTSDTETITDKKRLHYTKNYKRNVSRSITLHMCDIDSTSTLPESTISNSINKNRKTKTRILTDKWNKIRQKPLNENDSEFCSHQFYEEIDDEHQYYDSEEINNNKKNQRLTLKLDDYTMSTSQTSTTQQSARTQDSIIANCNSPSKKSRIRHNNDGDRCIKITRTNSRRYKHKAHKSFNQTWLPSLKILSEKTEVSTWDQSNNTCENIFQSNDYGLNGPQSNIFDSSELSFDDSRNIEQAYYDNDDSDKYTDIDCLNFSSDKYMHIVEAQRELQAAFLKGFTKGYSVGVQFQLTTFPPSHISISK